MKQLITQRDCLKCKQCCRFDSRNDYFAPVFTTKERNKVVKKGFDSKLFKKIGNDVWKLKLNSRFHCPFLGPKYQTCALVHDRPFDCKISPFILMWDKTKKHVWLCFHNDGCKPIDNKEPEKVKKYVNYLKKHLTSQKMQDFLSKHPELVWKNLSFFKKISRMDKITKRLRQG